MSHQPVAWMSDRGRNEVTKSPTVGTSQISPMSPRAIWMTQWLSAATSRPAGVRARDQAVGAARTRTYTLRFGRGGSGGLRLGGVGTGLTAGTTGRRRSGQE